MSDIALVPIRRIRPRPHRVNVRYSSEEYRHVVDQARIVNRRPGTFLRDLSLGSTLRPSPRLPKEVYRAVQSFGNNLNQLARQTNMGQAHVDAVEALRRKVDELLKALHR